tara:strand:- start:652 stop:846 length:195 start_codon:yes stop_codon:yes gene_type:complete
MTEQQQFDTAAASFLAPPKMLSTFEQNALADIANLIWPFPTKLLPAKPSKLIPINPENFEDAPF